MKKDDITMGGMLAEAVGIVSALIYLGLQVYYGAAFGVDFLRIGMNVAALLLVYAGLTLLAVYPERVNGLSREICTGKIRIYTIHMVRAAKLIFVGSLLFTSICDVMGHQLNGGYSLIVVVLIVAAALFYEVKIIRLLKERNKK